MAKLEGVRTTDAVCKVTESVRMIVQNGDLAKSLNTLRTNPDVPNPFVTSQPHLAGAASQSSAVQPLAPQSVDSKRE